MRLGVGRCVGVCLKDECGDCLLAQTCVFPRCVQSPEDAVFCAKFIKLLHNLRTPNLSTILM